MTPFQESLSKECKAAGVRVIFDVPVDLPSGKSVKPQAIFPDHGAKNGTLLFHTFAEYRELKDEIISSGYTCTQYGAPADCFFDPESLLEMLGEWGSARR